MPTKEQPLFKVKPEFTRLDIDGNFFDFKGLLILNNPENPAEVVERMNMMPAVYGYLGAIQASLEEHESKLTHESHVWIETKKARYDGDKTYGSEGAKERQVIVNNQVDYSKFQVSLREVRYRLRQVDVARKAVEKAIAMLQSIGRSLREEASIPGDYDLPGEKRGSLA